MAPGAFAVTVIARDEPGIQTTLSPMRNSGLFVGPSPAAGRYLLRIDWGGADPGDRGSLFVRPAIGRTRRLLAWRRQAPRPRELLLGAHAMVVEGVPGVRFAVWAPNARRVSVVGDFNTWDGRSPPDAGAAPRGWRLGDLVVLARLAPGALLRAI